MTPDTSRPIIITGASKGIGRACVDVFASNDYKVIAIARDCSELKKLSKKRGREVISLSYDLSKVTEVKMALRQITKEHGLPSGVIFNAAYAAGNDFINSTSADRKYEMQLNYHTPCLILEQLVDECEAAGGCHFIAVGSLSSVTSFPGNASYAASKSALNCLWRSLAQEFADSPNEFGFVLPGLTQTGMTDDISSLLPKRSPQKVAELIYQNFLEPQLDQTLGLENIIALYANRIAPRPVDELLKRFGKYILPK